MGDLLVHDSPPAVFADVLKLKISREILWKGGDLVNKKQNNERLCCPEFVPPGVPDDFCIPEECCPQRLETPKFPSPTSCLPEEQTRELEERIEATNELLLDLALSNERPEEGRMKSFEGLIGQLVDVKIKCVEAGEEEDPELNEGDVQGVSETALISKCFDTIEKEDEYKITPMGHTLTVDPDLPPKKKNQRKKKILNWRKKVGKFKNRKYKNRKIIIKKGVKNKKVSKRKRKGVVNKQVVNIAENGNLSGVVHVVGRDFVLLRKNKKEILIPLLRINSIKPHNRFAQPFNEPKLLDIDPCLRRALTFNFGETVASSPELIEIFFKLTLPIFLLICLEKMVKIKVADEEFEGTVVEVNKESLVISMRNGEKRDIPFHSICFIIM